MLTIEQDEIFDKEIITQSHSDSNVYRGEWDGKTVAIKEFTDETKKFFDNEVNIMSKLEHPYIMSLHGIINHPFLPSIVMDYMPNGTLTEYLRTNTQWNDESKIDMARRIGRGLVYLHENNILHLDLKTDNVLIDADEKPKITDFDISAELSEDQDVLKSDDCKGTRRWFTPEALNSVCLYHSETYKYSRETDVYTYALVIWSLYSLKKPYEAIDKHDIINSKISAGEHEDETEITEPVLQKLCVRAWSLTPKNRPQAEDFVSELARLTTW
jgi:serine/threonine protein kinase